LKTERSWVCLLSHKPVVTETRSRLPMKVADFFRSRLEIKKDFTGACISVRPAPIHFLIVVIDILVLLYIIYLILPHYERDGSGIDFVIIVVILAFIQIISHFAFVLFYQSEIIINGREINIIRKLCISLEKKIIPKDSISSAETVRTSKVTVPEGDRDREHYSVSLTVDDKKTLFGKFLSRDDAVKIVNTIGEQFGMQQETPEPEMET